MYTILLLSLTGLFDLSQARPQLSQGVKPLNNNKSSSPVTYTGGRIPLTPAIRCQPTGRYKETPYPGSMLLEFQLCDNGNECLLDARRDSTQSASTDSRYCYDVIPDDTFDRTCIGTGIMSTSRFPGAPYVELYNCEGGLQCYLDTRINVCYKK